LHRLDGLLVDTRRCLLKPPSCDEAFLTFEWKMLSTSVLDSECSSAVCAVWRWHIHGYIRPLFAYSLAPFNWRGPANRNSSRNGIVFAIFKEVAWQVETTGREFSDSDAVRLCFVRVASRNLFATLHLFRERSRNLKLADFDNTWRTSGVPCFQFRNLKVAWSAVLGRLEA